MKEVQNGAVAMPAEMMAQILGLIERLYEKIDRDPADDQSATQLAAILHEHSTVLKSALRPENQLHPDISYAHPEGRSVARPRLRRDVYFLGVPCQYEQLTDDEIHACNGITDSLELRDKRWQARVLKDQGGREILYLSVPFQSFDDIRGIGGLKDIVQQIQAAGIRPDTSDVLADRLAKAEQVIAELQASRVAQLDAPPASA